MKKILIAFFRQLLFWILFFDFSRIVFLVYHFRLLIIEKVRFSEVLGVFFHSLHLDLATTCYIMIIPFLLLVVQSLWSPKWFNLVNKIYTGIILFGYSLSVAGEMGIYAEWKTKLNYKVIKYLSHPSEIYNSAGTGTFYFLLLLLALIFLVGFFAYVKFFYTDLVRIRRNFIFSFLFLVITPGFIFIGMRGGIQQIPINQSESYYSKNNLLNLTSVNNGFNLYISIFENLPNFNHNPFVFMDSKLAEQTVSRIYHVRKDSTIRILKTVRPNIVLLILESWSADLIESLGGKPGITPQFRLMEKQGLLFDHIYAAGSRSEQGMACILSGFPANPVSSITVQPDKFVKLPSLPRLLEHEGYHTSFYFGGQLIYGNIKSFIYFNGFDKIMEGKDFPGDIPRGKLGIHDQYTLTYQIRDLNMEDQPFFSALFTVSTHAPWDQPFEKPLKWGDNEQEYINAAYYTDHCLGEYFQRVRKEPWFDNTLFIIVADHSHNSYYNFHPSSMEYHKIPLLLYGNVLKEEFRGKVSHKLGNQHDIAATLLAQMHLPADAFKWSKNLLNPFTPEFAFYSTEDGVGWIRPDGYFCWDEGPNYFYFNTLPKQLGDSIIREGKAYLQQVFGEYLND